MDGYDRDRQNVDNNTRGRIFENGADLFFGDTVNGYVQQSRIIRTPAGRVQFDKIREQDGRTHSIEEKSGRFEGEKDEKQLKALRALLERDSDHVHVVRSVEGEYVSKEVRKLIAGLQRDFPARFKHRTVSRTEAREIWALGMQLEKPLARGIQLELPGVREKAREQVSERADPGREKAFTQALGVGKELADQRERHREQVYEQVREIAERAEAGKPPTDTETLQKKHERLTKRLENIRLAERRQARGLLQSLGLRLSADRLQTMEQIKEEERERRREDVVRGLETIGKEVERGHWRDIAGEHNERVRQLGVEHVRAVQARFQSRAGPERDCALEQASRQVERLMITSERTAGLDLEKFRAVRDGRPAGYSSAGQTHTYERPDMPAIEVAHDAPERRLAEIVRDVDQGRSVEHVLTREVLARSHAAAVEEAVRSRLIPPSQMSPERNRERERGIGRVHERGR